MYVELPAVTATPAERLEALKNAKALLAASPKVTSGTFFAGGSTAPNDFGDPDEMIRLAEYITTGHDYKDTHPKGKRRPIIKNITKVTVMAPAEAGEPSREDIEHFLHHVENGDFTEFVESAINELRNSVKDRDGEGSEDEEAHRPVDPQDRPRFN